MIAEPTATPLTKPPLPTEATDVLLLLHVPLVVASVSITVSPAHTLLAPVIEVNVPGDVTINGWVI